MYAALYFCLCIPCSVPTTKNLVSSCLWRAFVTLQFEITSWSFIDILSVSVKIIIWLKELYS